MILEVRHGAAVVAVELDGSSGAARVLRGAAARCDGRRLGPGRYSLLLDDRVYDLWVEPSGDGYAVLGRGTELRLGLIDPRRLAAGSDLEEGGTGLRRIVAEMPGKVVRILVAAGDVVAFDQGLVVLEAMKMQNEIRAPRRAIVKEIGVKVGDAVGSGAFLLSLE